MPICLFFIAILAVGNLRGVKESGAVFSVPTYTFIFLIAGMIVYGLFLVFTQGPEAIAVPSSHEADRGRRDAVRLPVSCGPSPPVARR